MKPRASDYPVTATAVRRGRVARSRRTIRQTLQLLLDSKPDYESKGGKVRRWKQIPKCQWAIVGHSAADLGVIAVDGDDSRARFRSDSKAECETVLANALRQWWTLPRGREIETAAAARTEFHQPTN